MKALCRNCGAAAGQNYCPACGQAARESRSSLLDLIGTFFSEFLSLDGKHLRTATSLFVPGKLTQLFLEGKRASHTTPVRVYLVASLLFFVLVGVPAPDADKLNVYIDDILVGREQPEPGLSELQLFSLDRQSAVGTRFGAFLEPKLDMLKAMDAQELLDECFAGVERNVPTVLIFFVPVLALVLKLLYLRRDFFYVEHLVLALHFQSFMFVCFVVCHLANLAALGRLWPGWLTYVLAFFFVLPVHLLLALKRVYRQSWSMTVPKCALLGLLYLLLVPPTLLVTMFLVVGRM